jgi:hypothetical protein
MLQPPTLQVPRSPVVLWGARRGPIARAASLRADAKLWLLRLAMQAQREARQQPPQLALLRPLIDDAVLRLHEYCDYVRRELEPGLCARGKLVAGALRHFEQRTRSELAQLTDHIESAPHSSAVAQRVYVTARMLVGELNAHGRDVEG